METPEKGTKEFYRQILLDNPDVFDLEYLEKVSKYFNIKESQKTAMDERILELRGEGNGK